MAKSFIQAANSAGVAVKAGNGYLQIVNVTKAGSADTAVTIYDNPTAASGTVLYQGSGGFVGSFLQTSATGTPGQPAAAGMFIVTSGTTPATYQIIYE
jgi:hypothetical protein